MRSSFVGATLLAAALLPAAVASAQRPGSDTTNIFTPEMKFFEHPDPRIAQFEQAQRSGTHVRNIGAVELSPDGKRIAWMVAPAGATGTSGGGRRNAGMQLHISPALSPSTSEPTVSAGEGCSSDDPRWSPDGKTLAFVATCADHQPQIYLRDNAGKVSQLTQGRMDGR